MLVQPKLEVVSGVLPEPVGEYGLQMEEMVVKPDTGEFVPLFVTNYFKASNVCASRSGGWSSKSVGRWSEVDARVDDVSKEMLICSDGNLFSSVVASEYEFEVADTESGAEAARKLKLAGMHKQRWLLQPQMDCTSF